ncbi:hypothetical protein EI94DRAFT_1703007 [Lactarius quietus]|nr:hypothetical protein EI94DRAFT_1703007 [Lactarius quietus]
MALLTDLYCDLTYQDLALEFENHHARDVLRGGNRPLYASGVGPAAASDGPTSICTGVVKIAKLYVKLYPPKAHALALCHSFSESILGNSSVGERGLALPTTRKVFLFSPTSPSYTARAASRSIHLGAYRDIFDTIRGQISGVVAPNLALRTSTRVIEAFEDTPLEYVRREIHVTTPCHWQAAANVVKALVGRGSGARFLRHWRLAMARTHGRATMRRCIIASLRVAATGVRTLTQYVTATNPNLNIVRWFNDNIFGYIQVVTGGRVQPTLQVDVWCLYTFRNQARVVGGSHVHIHCGGTDPSLSMRVGGSTTLMFSSVQPFACQFLNVVLTGIGIQQSAERTAVNDFLIFCFFLNRCESHYHGEASTHR